MHRIEDNTYNIVKKVLKNYKIKLSKETLFEDLLAHPEYPSLRSVSYFFKKNKIDHYPAKLSIPDLESSESPFIAHLNVLGGTLILVSEIKGGQIKISYYDDKGQKKEMSRDEFKGYYSGISILLGRSNYSANKSERIRLQKEVLDKGVNWLGPVSLFIFSMVLLTPTSIGLDTRGLILLIKLAGLTASLVIALKSVSSNSSILDRLCNISKMRNCDSIVKSKGSFVFGWVQWSDVGLIYYLSTLIFLLTVGNWSIVYILAFLVLPFVFFSIYYQYKVAKSWCSLCLLVVSLMTIEAIIGFSSFGGVHVKLVELLSLASIMGIVAFVELSIKKIHLVSSKFHHEKSQSVKLKSSPRVLETFLYSEKRLNLDEKSAFFNFMGNDSKNTLTFFLSLNCKPCALAFEALRQSLEDGICNVRVAILANNESKKALNYLGSAYEESKDEFIRLLALWYSENRLLDKEKNINLNRQVIDYSDSQSQIFKRHGIKETPSIFWNSYRYPSFFDIKDIRYLVR